MAAHPVASAALLPLPSQGFAHLDVELADLLRRYLADLGMDANAPAVRWWCAALALTSRAHARGHVGLNGSVLQSPGGLDLLDPADPACSVAFRGFVQRWLQEAAASGLGAGDASEARVVQEAVLSSGLLCWDLQHLYLRRLWAAECRVAQSLADRSRQSTPCGAEQALQVEQLLQNWFGPEADQASADQQHACRQALHAPFLVLSGGPGTGKTYTAARLMALLQAMRPPGTPALRVALAAPTGKAAARLRHSMEQAWAQLHGRGLPDSFWTESWAAVEPPQTVHALLAQWRRRARNGALNRSTPARGHAPAPGLEASVDVLLVDEASMLDIELMDELLMHLPAQARLVLIGDPAQLASVEAGSILADLCGALASHPGHVALRHSRRFDGTIGAWARGLQAQDADVLRDIEAHAQSDRHTLIETAVGPLGWEPFFQALSSRPVATSGQAIAADVVAQLLKEVDRFRVLAALRQGPWGVEGLNHDIERALAARGHLNRSEAWPHGRVLMITRNDDATGLRNGDVGVVLAPLGSAPRFVWMAGQELRSVGVSRLPPHELAYAMTVHKSQGSEFDRVVLVLPDSDHPVLCRELLYTGLTRAKRDLLWFLPNPSLLGAAASRTTRRMGGLWPRLDALTRPDGA